MSQLHCTSADGKLLWKSAPGLLATAPHCLAATAETASRAPPRRRRGHRHPRSRRGNGGSTSARARRRGGKPLALLGPSRPAAGTREPISAAPDLEIRAFGDSGLALWTYDGLDFAPDARLLAPLAWADVDSDGAPEGFGVSSQGFFRLAAAGRFDWLVEADGALAAPPILFYDDARDAYTLAVAARGVVYALVRTPATPCGPRPSKKRPGNRPGSPAPT